MKKLNIAYKGHPGAHSECALHAFIESTRVQPMAPHPLLGRLHLTETAGSEGEALVECVPMRSVVDVCEALTSAHSPVNFAWVPIENTQSGTFVQVYDTLLQYLNRVHIVAEWLYHPTHCLLVHGENQEEDVDLSSITHLLSHPHALQECRALVKRIQPQHTLCFEDTALAAQYLRSSKQPHTAVIAHPQAAKLYNLRPLLESVEDDPASATRYLLLAPHALSLSDLHVCAQASPMKTSLVIGLKNAPGQLFKALACFALRDLNLSKLESRPSPRGARTVQGCVWEYVNYVDVEGGLQELAVRQALSHLQEFASQVKVLGSYPKCSGIGQGDVSPMGGPFMGM